MSFSRISTFVTTKFAGVRPCIFSRSMAAYVVWSFVWLDNIRATKIWKRLDCKHKHTNILKNLWNLWAVYTFSSAASSPHLWQPMVSTGASRPCRMIRIFSSICRQFCGSHFSDNIVVFGSSFTSGNGAAASCTPGNSVPATSVEFISSNSFFIFFIGTSWEYASDFKPFFIRDSFLTLGKCWETDGMIFGVLVSVYSILILFRVRRGEKYGEVTILFWILG